MIKLLCKSGAFLLFIFQLYNYSLNAQTYEAINAGNWTNPSTWSGGNVPPITDHGSAVTILMQGADKDITLNSSISVTDGYAYNFEINSGTLSIYGNVTITGSSSFKTQGSGKIKVYGNLNLGPGTNLICSQLIEVFGNVFISGSSSVNINGGPFIVHGNYVSSSGTTITPDAVFAVEGTFEGNLISYNGNGNLYVATQNYNLLPPVPPQAVCTPSYSGPNTSSQCPVGDFVDLANREPAIYNEFFGSTSLTLYNVSGINYCGTASGIVNLSGSTAGITYELYKNGVYTGISQTGTGSPLSYMVTGVGNYRVRATNGTLWRFMNGVAIITSGTPPSIASITNGGNCGPGQVSLSATPSPGTAIIRWYDQITGGTLLNSGNNFTTPNISTTTKYYIEADDNGCVSTPRVEVTAEIWEIPSTNPITHD